MCGLCRVVSCRVRNCKWRPALSVAPQAPAVSRVEVARVRVLLLSWIRDLNLSWDMAHADAQTERRNVSRSSRRSRIGRVTPLIAFHHHTKTIQNTAHGRDTPGVLDGERGTRLRARREPEHRPR